MSNMSMFSFSREPSVMSSAASVRSVSIASTYGSNHTDWSSTTTTTMTSEIPTEEEANILKEKKKLYGTGMKKIKPVSDEQLVMFDPTVIHFPQWKIKFEKLLESREIEDEPTRKKILLKALLPQTIEIIPKLFRSRLDEPFEQDTSVLLSKLENYYDKVERAHRIKARIKFFSTVQSDKHFYAFANSLKDQLFDCDFGPFEEDALIMCFVMGLSSPVLRKHLLQKEAWLTSFLETIELAIKFQDVLPAEVRKEHCSSLSEDSRRGGV